jgi:hypothetical protein
MIVTVALLVGHPLAGIGAGRGSIAAAPLLQGSFFASPSPAASARNGFGFSQQRVLFGADRPALAHVPFRAICYGAYDAAPLAGRKIPTVQ